MNESMLDRLVSMENRYEELGHMLQKNKHLYKLLMICFKNIKK